MDKRLEAIQWLKEEQDRLRDDSTYKPLLKIAIADMEKQIPKEPREHYNWCDSSIRERKEKTQWFCRKCNQGIGESENYCTNCGQAIG